jgi:hypothetical protein
VCSDEGAFAAICPFPPTIIAYGRVITNGHRSANQGCRNIHQHLATQTSALPSALRMIALIAHGVVAHIMGIRPPIRLAPRSRSRAW